MGGAEKLMLELLPRLKAAGHEVDLLLFDGEMTPLRRQVEDAGIRVFELSRKGRWVYNPLNILQLCPYMRRYDIVHTHNTAPQLFAAVNRVLCSAVLCTTEHTTSNRRRDWKWYAPIDRWMYSRYDRVVCISAKAEENLRAHIGSQSPRILTINNGVPLAAYENAEPSTALEKIAPGSKKLIMVAGFRWEKDQDTVIRAMNCLPDNFHLFFAGDGIRRAECEQLAAELGVTHRVHFLGIRGDVPSLLRAADYVVMSSHFEGLSLSSIEGMCVGKPMIASNVDGLREVVDGAGVLFEHHNPASLAEWVARLDADPKLYAAVAEKCRERARQFDISVMVSGYLNLYNQLKQNN
jgi:glycosyltransferase involved in cell wall biosynthesis